MVFAPGEIRVLIQGRMPAYIGWEQYLANQRRISENRSFPSSQGASRRQGIAQRADRLRWLRAAHERGLLSREDKEAALLVRRTYHEERERPCFGLKAPPVDELVAQQLLGALEPAAVDLSLQAAADIERERERLHQHWRQRLARARTSRARERQYQSVEPENRLVARTLEQHWEDRCVSSANCVRNTTASWRRRRPA